MSDFAVNDIEQKKYIENPCYTLDTAYAHPKINLMITLSAHKKSIKRKLAAILRNTPPSLAAGKTLSYMGILVSFLTGLVQGSDISGPRLYIVTENNQLLLRYDSGNQQGLFTIVEANAVDSIAIQSRVVLQGTIAPGQQGALPLNGRDLTRAQFYRMSVSSIITNPAPDRLVWISPGTFQQGSAPTDPDFQSDETPRTTVTLNWGFWLDKTEVTQAQFQEITGSNPSHFTGDATLPVDQVSWEDATNYCALLTARERQAGRLPDGYEYRLPTEAEWEYAARAGSTNRFAFGDDWDYSQLGMHAWHGSNSTNRTHPVATKTPNALGLFDLAGNVAEWCRDYYAPYADGKLTDPQGPVTGAWRVNRGGSWDDEALYCRPAARGGDWPNLKLANVGFRVALPPTSTAVVWHGLPMVWASSGTFLMGSPDTEEKRESDEGLQTKVTLTHGFWIGRHEVTQREYAFVMGTNDSQFLGFPEQPVEQVSWDQALDFCTRLTEIERQQGRLPEGYVYRLPTEAEWEYAARAGTTTSYSFGETPSNTAMAQYCWYLRNADFTTHPVERKLPNPWGIYDMTGNVAEWCWDWYGRYPFFSAIDPAGPDEGDSHVIRGGSFYDDAEFCRNAFRLIAWNADLFYNVGFRVVLAKPLSDR